MDDKKKAKLGQRWVCFSCEGRFYDLNKPEPVCPKCGSNQLESPLVKKKPTRKRKATKKTTKKASRKSAPPRVRSIDDDDEQPKEGEEAVDFEELDLGGSDQLGSVQVDED